MKHHYGKLCGKKKGEEKVRVPLKYKQQGLLSSTKDWQKKRGEGVISSLRRKQVRPEKEKSLGKKGW